MTGAVISGPAFAQAADATMPMSAEVVQRCNVTATPMRFTVANPGANTNVDSSATVRVECSAFSFFLVELDNGENAVGNQRRMVGAYNGGTLNYEIYKNAARTQRWGQGFFGGRLGLIFGTGAVNFTAYGRIPTVTTFDAADAYYDNIVVTVSF